MADSNVEDKSRLSKNLLQMKFMRRSVIRIEKEQNEEEQRRVIDDEHWVLDIPELQEKESRYQLEPSYAPCENLVFGRMSFKGLNPEIEKLMTVQEVEESLKISEAKEKELMVDEDEMTKRYETLIGTIAKKFAKKRHRSAVNSEVSEGSSNPKKAKREFLKPGD
ncbi:M-phase phosphoprotein 6-like [Liolophura sinensis]|uniref:M-phase phosphoprotein 6-like n=1 Tax=Liolophura sinensis TaxID=3198878 RepID=UPI00315988E3